MFRSPVNHTFTYLLQTLRRLQGATRELQACYYRLKLLLTNNYDMFLICF